MATLTDDEDRRASLPETKNVKGQVDKEKKNENYFDNSAFLDCCFGDGAKSLPK